MNPDFIAYLCVVGLGAVLGLFFYDRLSVPFKCLVWLLMLTTLNEGITRFKWIRPYNIYLYWSYAILTVALYGRMLATMCTSKFYRRAVMFLGGAVILFGLIWFIPYKGYLDFPSRFLVIVHVYWVLAGVIVFVDMLGNASNVPLKKRAYFWLNSAVFVYSGLSVFIFSVAFFSQTQEDVQFKELMQSIQYWFVMAYYTFVGGAIFYETQTNRPA